MTGMSDRAHRLRELLAEIHRYSEPAARRAGAALRFRGVAQEVWPALRAMAPEMSPDVESFLHECLPDPSLRFCMHVDGSFWREHAISGVDPSWFDDDDEWFRALTDNTCVPFAFDSGEGAPVALQLATGAVYLLSLAGIPWMGPIEGFAIRRFPDLVSFLIEAVVSTRSRLIWDLMFALHGGDSKEIRAAARDVCDAGWDPMEIADSVDDRWPAVKRLADAALADMTPEDIAGIPRGTRVRLLIDLGPEEGGPAKGDEGVVIRTGMLGDFVYCNVQFAQHTFHLGVEQFEIVSTPP